MSTTELDITGKTRASCAARVEKRVDGVTATVNFATARATAHAPEGVSVEDLVAEVEAAGYQAARFDPEDEVEDTDAEEARGYRTRLVTSLVLTVPVVAMAMVPAPQVDGWQ